MPRRFLSKYDAYKGEWLRTAEYFFLLFAVLFLVFRFLIGISWVSGPSMQPTYQSGDAVVYTRLYSQLQVGSIVSVRMPDGEYYIKRVAALPGDVVDISDGILTVNGIPEEQQPETFSQSTSVEYPLIIPKDRYFVLGDNREVSIDSRTFGAVSRSQIRGVIIFSFS